LIISILYTVDYKEVLWAEPPSVVQSLEEEEEDLYEFSLNNPLRGLVDLVFG
jgi:hypothetical protein